jgi:hypothetical protein
MRRQCRGDIRLALYRVYRVIFAAHNEGRTLDAMKIREHVERLAQWSASETLHTANVVMRHTTPVGFHLLPIIGGLDCMRTRLFP